MVSLKTIPVFKRKWRKTLPFGAAQTWGRTPRDFKSAFDLKKCIHTLVYAVFLMEKVRLKARHFLQSLEACKKRALDTSFITAIRVSVSLSSCKAKVANSNYL